MSGLSLLSEIAVLSQPWEKTLVFAVWYSALLWLPIRGLAALVDRRREQEELQHARQSVTGPCYHVGMKILPPM